MNVHIRPYEPSDEELVIKLWCQCSLVTSANNPRLDITRKCQVNPELFLVAVLDEKIVGTCMAGYEGHRGWINYLAVAPASQRQGIARQLMETAERNLAALGCPKINLQVRETNTGVIAFYRTLGFAQDPVVSMGKRLSRDPEYQSSE
jgi:ribosomal protein S18 acetylase RimI-like enzyme